MTHVACELELRSVVRSSMPRKLAGNRACGLVFCPDYPHLVQELNVGTVLGLMQHIHLSFGISFLVTFSAILQ